MGLIVCGLNGAGKGTLGRALAGRLHYHYEREERFFALVRSREEDTVKKWLRHLSCPVRRVDGTRPVEENVNLITSTSFL